MYKFVRPPLTISSIEYNYIQVSNISRYINEPRNMKMLWSLYILANDKFVASKNGATHNIVGD